MTRTHIEHLPGPAIRLRSRPFQSRLAGHRSGREDSDNDPGSPFVPSRPASPHPPSDGGGESDLENDEETFPASLDAKQSQKARSPRWLPWEDRYLAQQAEKLRLFAPQRGDERRKAWDGLAVDLLKASTINGKPINRTGPACRARLEKLLDAQRREQTRSLQLTGTNQEVDDHPELMTHLVELVDAQKHEKDAKSNSARKKIDVETKAARDGAMKGLVRREALTDVSSLEGASVREKQGQRKYVNMAQAGLENCDEPKPKRRRNQLTHIVKNRNAADAKQLEQARKLEQDRHNESMALQHRTLEIQEQISSGIGKLTDGMAALANAQAALLNAETNRSEAAARMQYEDSERRRIDAEHRAAEAERHASFLAAVSHKK
ncbi:Myb-like domain-containing protein [Favolaschia claudopus]|uniref:Myb-like domain-containing protein n=1 Tax=Favolaschia claudopus TaxID=2862362 RepID=A0AAV9ZR79_9AGAR